MGPHQDFKYKLLIPLFALTWIVFTLFRTLMILLGWVLIPTAAALGAYEAYMGADGFGTPRTQYRFTWKLLYPFQNPEDGIANATYKEWDSMFMKIVYWSAFRNPANNLRTMPFISLKIDPKKIKWFGSHNIPSIYDMKPASEEWFICWHGFYSCWWWQFKLFGSVGRLWIGTTKLFPADFQGVTGHRSKYGAGIPSQLKKIS